MVNDSNVFRASNLQDYACKQWAGLLRTYYAPRWQLFLNMTLAQLGGSRSTTRISADTEKHEAPKFDVQAFQTASFAWFERWREDEALESTYATEPKGDPLKLSQALYTKYSDVIEWLH